MLAPVNDETVPGRPETVAGQAIALSFFRFGGAANRLWAFSQMQFSRAAFNRTPGIGFAKMFGSGTGEGFTPIPNFGVYALMGTWDGLAEARRAIAGSAVYDRYRSHAAEHWTVYIQAVSSRGVWDADEPFDIVPAGEPPLPMAVLTRATVKPRHAVSFWRWAPDISTTVREETHMLFKIGIGEVPWLQQVTFSIWDDVQAMKDFAYRSRFHSAAIKQVRRNGWFREELYARFRVLGFEGRWGGRDPLPADLKLPVEHA